MRSKIWLRVTALAVLNCICGVTAFFGLSLVISEPFINVFLVSLFCAFCTVAFGWWLSNDVMGPIETVTLLAKSLERSSTTTLPKSTGAAETDDLLAALHRNSRQLQSIIVMMEDVAAGRTDTALTPLESSDRLTNAFQRLIGRVTDSIDAKTELESIVGAVDRLKSDISSVRDGNLNISVRTDAPATREIAETVRFLTSRLNELSLNVNISSKEAERSLSELRSLVRAASGKEDANTRRIRAAAEAVAKAPDPVGLVTDQLAGVIAASGSSSLKFAEGSDAAKQNAASITLLRKELTDLLHKLQKLRDQLNTVPQIAKSADDLARRSNMIALNTSMRSSEPAGAANIGISLLADEISTLSYRAEDVSKELAAIKNSAVRDIGDLESRLSSTVSSLSDFSMEATKIIEALDALGDFLARVTELPAQISADPQLQTDAAEVQNLLGDCLQEDEELKISFGMCEEKTARLSHILENLRDSAAGLRNGSPGAAAISDEATLDIDGPPAYQHPAGDEGLLDIWSDN